MLVLLLSLTTTSSAIEWLVATMVAEWWSAQGVTPEDEYAMYEFIHHDLWAHAAHGYGVCHEGETHAQVIQETLSNDWCTVTSLTMYWHQVHSMLPPANVADILLETKPLADEIRSEWQFAEYLTQRVSSCCRYLLFPDSLW